MAQLSNLKRDLLDRVKALLGPCNTQSDAKRELNDTEVTLRNLLIPHESRIMWIQSLLVWENPWHTGAFFIATNLSFWYVLNVY